MHHVTTITDHHAAAQAHAQRVAQDARRDGFTEPECVTMFEVAYAAEVSRLTEKVPA